MKRKVLLLAFAVVFAALCVLTLAVCKKVKTIVKTIDNNNDSIITREYILFGEYPQTVKADDVDITDTTDSRGYYLGSDGAYYAKVTANPESNQKFTTGATITRGTIYYFKVEPIKWRILEKADGKATLLCEMIIDAHRFDDSSNNYKESEIRAWLIGEFYETAFNDLEQQMINTVLVKNDARSTNPDNNASEWNGGANQYACEDTYDKVFLLSMQEVTKEGYGFATDPSVSDTARSKKVTNYARANYADVYIPSGFGSSDYAGNGLWWLRSPYYSSGVWSIGRSGYSKYSSIGGSGEGYNGIAPALQITL